MADPVTPQTRIVALVAYYILVIICSLYGVFIFLLQLIRFGLSLFSFRQRPTPPACLNDPDLGEHSYIRLKDVKLHYVKNGDPSKPLMLFVHGFPEFWYSWRYQLREFSKDYWVVAVDQRGYSESDKPQGKGAYKLETLSSDVKELINGLGRSSCHLVAHDWGGIVAYDFAMQYPSMVDSLVILNAPHPVAFYELLKTNIRQILKSWYMFFFQMPFLPELFIRWNDFNTFDRLFGTEQIKQNFSKEDIEAFKYAFGRPGALTCPINYYRSLEIVDGWLNSAQNAAKPKLTMPSLIVWGNQDSALSTSLAYMSAKLFEKCEVKIVEGASHWVQQESYQAVNKHIREFQNGLSLHR